MGVVLLRRGSGGNRRSHHRITLRTPSSSLSSSSLSSLPMLVFLFISSARISNKNLFTLASISKGRNEECTVVVGSGSNDAIDAIGAPECHRFDLDVDDVDVDDGGNGGGDEHRNSGIDPFPSVLETARSLEPPFATSTDLAETEGAEWWSDNGDLLRSAWKMWDTTCSDAHNLLLLLPRLGEDLIDADLNTAVDRITSSCTTENEAAVLGFWERVPFLAAADNESSTSTSTTTTTTSSSAATENTTNSNSINNINNNSNSSDGDGGYHRVFRYPGFLTESGIRKLRQHLDEIHRSGIPTRRPNSMNRNGLLLDPNVPGGVSGDPTLHAFVELLVSRYLRPLGRSFFPEFAGHESSSSPQSPSDDSNHYAFTIRYGSPDDDLGIGNKNSTSTEATATTETETTSKQSAAMADWDLKTHSDASLYTLNININLPEEDYSGSTLYFLKDKKRHTGEQERGRAQAQAADTATVRFEPGTAVLHRGMTRHGAETLGSGQRHNLVIWLFGGGNGDNNKNNDNSDGYVRIAPYRESERMPLCDRWTAPSDLSSWRSVFKIPENV